MKKTHWMFLAAGALLQVGVVQAEWKEIAQFEDGMRVYVDPATVRREGSTAQVQHLVRWAEPQEEPEQAPYRSTVVRTVYDCAKKHERYLSSVSFSGTMGNGIKVAADGQEVDHWYSISDGSMEDKLWQVACAAK